MSTSTGTRSVLPSTSWAVTRLSAAVSADRLIAHLEDDVFRLQGEFRGCRPTPAANRMDQDAAGVLAMAFQGHHAGNVAGGDAPFLDFQRVA